MKDLKNKIRHIVSASLTGVLLGTTAQAAEFGQLASADSYMKSVNNASSKYTAYQLQMSGDEAIEKGLNLLRRAETAEQFRTAASYITYAANKGYPEGMFRLAILYLDNQFLPADDEFAMELLEKASLYGHQQAENALNFIRYAEAGLGC